MRGKGVRSRKINDYLSLTVCPVLFLLLPNHYKNTTTLLSVPISQMGKPEHREVKQIACGHIASMGLSPL